MAASISITSILLGDDARSLDFIGEFGDDEEPDLAHGTAVAGVAVAINNGRDVVGVSQGARVASVRVLNSNGQGSSDVFVAGFSYVAKLGRPGDVVNLSLEAGGTSDVLEAAIARTADRGLSIAIAGGNSQLDVAKVTPAGTRDPPGYTVSAYGQDDCLAVFSNHGLGVDMAAPGSDVLTLRPGFGTAVADGTSFAAPHVAGLPLSGQLASEGTVCSDRDGRADPIAQAPP